MKENSKDLQKFEQQKISLENQRNEEELKELKNKFSKILEENPIAFYNFDNYREVNKYEKEGELNFVSGIEVDKSGKGDGVKLSFNYGNFIKVETKKEQPVSLSNNLYRKNITEESFQNILTMMYDLIKISGYSDSEKEKMFQGLNNFFKGSVVNKKLLENN